MRCYPRNARGSCSGGCGNRIAEPKLLRPAATLTHSSYSLQHRFMDIIVSIFFEKASPNFAKGGKIFRNGRTADKTYRPTAHAVVGERTAGPGAMLPI